jgi:amino acid permease
MTRYWVELVLPLYSMFAVFVYFRPGALPGQVDQSMSLINSVFTWLAWGLVASLTGVLAISALFLTFYLLYSPFYLANQVKRLWEPRKWVDSRELRFYLWCFVLLCLLSGLALSNPTAAAVVFTILAGSAQLLWRVLV